MRVLLRKEISDKHPNLRKLKPLTKIMVAVKLKYQDSSFYKNNKKKKDAEVFKRRAKEEECIKNSILKQINDGFQKDKSIEWIVLEVDIRYSRLLFDRYSDDGDLIYRGLLSSDEFYPYSVTRIRENHDIRVAFKNMPMLLKVRKREVLSDETKNS